MTLHIIGPLTGICVLLLQFVVIFQISARSSFSVDYFHFGVGKSILVCLSVLHVVKVLTAIGPLALVPESFLCKTCTAQSISIVYLTGRLLDFAMSRRIFLLNLHGVKDIRTSHIQGKEVVLGALSCFASKHTLSKCYYRR